MNARKANDLLVLQTPEQASAVALVIFPRFRSRLTSFFNFLCDQIRPAKGESRVGGSLLCSGPFHAASSPPRHEHDFLAAANVIMQFGHCRGCSVINSTWNGRVYLIPSNFSNSFSSKIVTPNAWALSYFDPGSVPTTT